MDRIHGGKARMRPRLYFVAGSLLVLIGLTVSIVVSTFLVGVTRFAVRSHGPGGSYRLDQMLASFPWWAPLIALLAIATGVWLLRRYDFSYKKNFWLIVVGFILAVVIAGFILDTTGLNDSWFSRGPMRGMMRNYLESTAQPPFGGSFRAFPGDTL